MFDSASCKIMGQQYNKENHVINEHECPDGFRAYKQLGSFMIHEAKRLMLHKIKSLISCDTD